MHRSFLTLCFLLGTCSLVGFGCKERGTASLPGISPSTPPRAEVPFVPKQGGVEKGIAPEIVTIRQILTNLNKAQSYQADLQLPASSGSAVGRLLYAKNRGMLASLQSGESRSELYLSASDDTAFVRYATNSWSNVPKDEEGQGVRAQLKSAFFFDDTGGNSLLIRDSATVINTKEDPRGCTLYTLKQTFYVPDTITEQIELCLTSAYPVYIRLVRPAGTSIIQYSRIDDPSILTQSPVN